jgi:hypothetical protein
MFWLNPTTDERHEFSYDKDMCEWGASSITEARYVS